MPTKWTAERTSQIIDALKAFVWSRAALTWMRCDPNRDANDVQNELFLNLASSPGAARLLADAKGDEDVRRLVFKCAMPHLKNYAIRTHERHRRRQRGLVYQQEHASQAKRLNGNSLQDPFQCARDIALRLDLWHVLHALPCELRAVVELRSQNLTTAEISQRLHVCSKTVTRRLRHVREILTSKLHLN